MSRAREKCRPPAGSQPLEECECTCTHLFVTVSSSSSSSTPSEVSPSAPGVTEMEAAESESSVVSQPPPGTEPENREDCTDEVRSPKKVGWGGGAAAVGGRAPRSSLFVRLTLLPHSLAACCCRQDAFKVTSSQAQPGADPCSFPVRTLDQFWNGLKLF